MSGKKKHKSRNRTIYYFRCNFKPQDGEVIINSLDQMVAASWESLSNSLERTFPVANGRTIVGMKSSYAKARLKSEDNNCIQLSVGLYEEGAPVNTISKPATGEVELEAGTIDAPSLQEYLDGEGFICIYGNHIAMSPSDTLRTGLINNFLESLIRKGGFTNEALALDIQQVADINVVKTLKNEGVKEISLNASVYLNSLSYLERTKRNFTSSSRIEKLSNMAKSWVAPLCDDDTQDEIAAGENLNAKIIISHDGRSFNDSSEVGNEKLKNTAISLVDAEVEGYVIVTKSGKKLKHDEIVLKNSVKVTAHGKSVRREEIWNHLIQSIERYEREGILEQ